jgi:cell division protein FtsN
LGLILGVLLGLVGALVVAVYVTKVPVPFVERVISRPASDDAAEADRNRNWNPNAVLGGKSAKGTAKADAPADPAPSDAAPAPEPAKKAEAPAKPTEAAKAPVEAPVEPKGKTYSSDPLGDLASSKVQGKTVAATTPREAPAPAAAEPFTFFVQVGAFRTPEDAQAQRAKLVLMGLDAKVSEREQNGKTVYRVRLGPYERLSDAEKMKEDLAPSGLETALVRVQR